MPCPGTISVGLFAVFGGGYVLLVRDQLRPLWWLLTLGTIIGWVLYFTSYRGNHSILRATEAVTMALVIGGALRVRVLRKRGEMIPGEEFAFRVWKVFTAMTHPILLVLKAVFVVLLVLKVVPSFKVDSTIYWTMLSLIIVGYAMRIQRGVEVWKQTAKKDLQTEELQKCPVHTG